MGKEISTFANIQYEKNKFQCHKTLILLADVDIEKVLASGKISFAQKNYKCFIGYLYDNYKVKPLHVMLPKTTAHAKSWTD